MSISLLPVEKFPAAIFDWILLDSKFDSKFESEKFQSSGERDFKSGNSLEESKIADFIGRFAKAQVCLHLSFGGKLQETDWHSIHRNCTLSVNEKLQCSPMMFCNGTLLNSGQSE